MQHSRFALVLAALLPLVVPSGAEAQRKDRGTKVGDWDQLAGAAPKGPTISRADLEKMSPLRMFVDKKKDLKLDDTQVATLTASDATLREANAARYSAVDSLKKLMKPSTGGAPSLEDQARMAIAKESMMETLDAIRDSYDEAAKESVSTLTPEQQQAAAALLVKHHEEMQKTLRDKVGAGNRPASGRPRGRGPA